jgi:SAM-dependent methyltransferase
MRPRQTRHAKMMAGWDLGFSGVGLTSDERWLASVWPFVHAHLPPPPARVLELGCGPLGGFVPALLSRGYDAVGVDPEAPEGSSFHRMAFEQFTPSGPVDAIVASTSLHHVADVGDVLDRIAAVLKPGGLLVVVEWAWEQFDEDTARWCFARLAQPEPGCEPGWLHRRRNDWAASGQSWAVYWSTWAAQEGLHPASEILHALDARFDRRLVEYTPYFFPDLADIEEADERAAAAAQEIRATGVRYVAQRTA